LTRKLGRWRVFAQRASCCGRLVGVTLVAALVTGHFGCGGSSGGPLCLLCAPAPTGPCSANDPFEISGFESADYGNGAALLPVGHSRNLAVLPRYFPGCQGGVEATRWNSSRPEVAAFEAQSGWLTGLSPGDTSVSARVSFTDGTSTTAYGLYPSRGAVPVRVVVPTEPEGRRLLLEGTVDLEGERTDGGWIPRATTRAYLVFEVPEDGLVDMVVDWDSAASPVIAHVCRGVIEFDWGCVPIIDGAQLTGRKPMIGSVRTSSGQHTLWITNGGREPEVVRYSVGLVPDAEG
jgi:hypothetical protein